MNRGRVVCFIMFIITLIPLQFAHAFFLFLGLDQEAADYAQYFVNAQVIGLLFMVMNMLEK